MAHGASASSYACLAASSVWTLGWVASAALAAARVIASFETEAIVAFVVAATLASGGSLIMVRVARRNVAPNADGPRVEEPWSRRVSGWIAGAGWCAVAIMWNVGVMALQLGAAGKGNGWLLLMPIIPLSLIGWFLMFVLFIGVGVVIDWARGMHQRRGAEEPPLAKKGE